MKIKFKTLLLSFLAIIALVQSITVFAAVSTQIKTGGEKLEFNYNTNSNSNKSGTADFKYSNEYPGGLLVLNNYNGGLIEINHIVGTGTAETTPKEVYIRLEGDNKITSDDIAISSNINFNIIGTGTLTITAKTLNNDDVKATIENDEKIKFLNDEEEENVENENNEVVEEVEEKNDTTDTLSIVAIISIIILCSLGCVFFITGIRKNLR